jgi:hypothetical protein
VLSYDLSNDLSAFGGPVLQFSREDGADWGDSFTGGAILGASYECSDDLTLGGGVGVVSQIEDDVRFFPIIIVNWKISDTLRVASGGSAASSRADIGLTGVELVWTPIERWEFAIGAAKEFNRFRLSEDNAIADGVGEDEYFPLWLRASCDVNDDISLSAMAGISLNGQIKLEDSDGDSIDEDDYDPAPFIGVFGSVRF